MHEPNYLSDASTPLPAASSLVNSTEGTGENGVSPIPPPASEEPLFAVHEASPSPLVMTSVVTPPVVIPEVNAASEGASFEASPMADATPLESTAAMTVAPAVPVEATSTFVAAPLYAPVPLAPVAPAYAPTPYGSSPAPEPYVPASYGTPSAPSTPAKLPMSPNPPLSSAEPLAAQPPRASAMNPVIALLVGGVLSCALFGMGMGLQKRLDGATPNSQVESAGGALPVVNDKSGNAIINTVRAVGPAVMNVDTTFGKSGDSEFLPEPGSDSNTPRRGKGTGVVIDSAKGLMLTNAHVVAGAQDIQVTTRDGKVYRGKVLGADRYNDIAVVRLNTKNDKLPAARLANFKDPKELSIGQWTIAIGNPYAQANSVTVGVLSAVGRDIPVPGPDGEAQFKLTDMMQTDAAINPGNSGGPLCNINGEVIGINTAIIPFATGLGFTIPISKAKSVADMLISNNGQIPYIGIQMTPVTDALKQEFGLSDKKGALVKTVEPNSPAAQAGIQPGDVLRMVDGKAIIGGEDIQGIVRLKKVGSPMDMTIVRNSANTKTVTIKVGARPSQ